MARYRKKPVVIEALQLDRTNALEIADWSGGYCLNATVLGLMTVHIPTLEGEMTASVGDYIIRGVNGEHYPCKPDIFLKTYDPVP